MNILLVDDDQDIIENLELTFRVSWPQSRITSTGSGREAVQLVENKQPDLVVLDLGLPDINGFDALKQIRAFSSVPVIVLTVRNEEQSIVKAFDRGADEYLVKPFHAMELLARIKNVLKRQYHASPASYSLGPMNIDLANNILSAGRKKVRLTSFESTILNILLSNMERPVTSAQLIEGVWGENDPTYNRVLRVHIRRLRQKIEADPDNPRYILTQRGAGYQIRNPSE